MSGNSSQTTATSPPTENIKYKGIRRRRWGKWVSEIRVPSTQERLWLGSFSTAEAAAVAHDLAYYCLRRPTTLENLNFPNMLPDRVLHAQMSPRSIQNAASDIGMAVDAQYIAKRLEEGGMEENETCMTRVATEESDSAATEAPNVSIDDYL